MNERILKRIANLMSVKSIVTLVLTGVFAYMAITGNISQDFMTIYAVIIAFYFGTQSQKVQDAVGGDDNVSEYQRYLARMGYAAKNATRPTFHSVKAGLAFDICKNVKGHEYDDPSFFARCGQIGKQDMGAVRFWLGITRRKWRSTWIRQRLTK